MAKARVTYVTGAKREAYFSRLREKNEKALSRIRTMAYAGECQACRLMIGVGETVCPRCGANTKGA